MINTVGIVQEIKIGGGKVFHKGVADTSGLPLAPLSGLGSP